MRVLQHHTVHVSRKLLLTARDRVQPCSQLSSTDGRCSTKQLAQMMMTVMLVLARDDQMSVSVPVTGRAKPGRL